MSCCGSTLSNSSFRSVSLSRLFFSGSVTEKTDYAVVMLYMHIQMAWPQVAHLSRDSLQQQSAICLLLLNILDDNSHYSFNKYASISLPLISVWERICKIFFQTAVRWKDRWSMLALLRKRAPLINCTYFLHLSLIHI